MHRHDAIRKKVLPRPGPAIKIRRRAARPEIDHPPFLIHHHSTPAVGPADPPVGVLRPGSITGVSRQRYGMEYPFQSACDDIKGAHMPRRRVTVLRHAAADDERILIDDARR